VSCAHRRDGRCSIPVSRMLSHYSLAALMANIFNSSMLCSMPVAECSVQGECSVSYASAD